MKKQENLRKEAKSAFNDTNIKNTPMNWHVWKRAYELGYRSAEIQQATI